MNDCQRTSQSANYPLKNDKDFLYNYLMKNNCKSPPQVVSPFQSLSSENAKQKKFPGLNSADKSPYNDFINHNQNQHKNSIQMKQVQKMKSETSLTSMDLKSEMPNKVKIDHLAATKINESNANAYDVIRAAHNNSV